jgi:phthalate 4,5-cis-dihydrodiol dehydrogenase
MKMEDVNRIRLGFIGCGTQSSNHLQPNVPPIDEIDYVAAADLDESRATKAAKRYGVKPYKDFKKMITGERLDAVAIVGPPEIHRQIGIECLNMGVHIFIEKPPAMTSQSAKELLDTAKRNGKFGMVGTQWRHDPAHKIMRDLMQKPEFGQPTYFHGHFLSPGLPFGLWGTETAFKGFLLGQGVHIIDCTRFLMGDIVNVYASSFEGKDGAVAMNVSIIFQNGGTGHIGLAAEVPIQETSMLAIGDGEQIIEVRNGNHLRMSKKDSWCSTKGGFFDHPSLEWDVGWGAHFGYRRVAYCEELRHFAQCLLKGDQPHASLEDGYKAMVVIEAIDESRKQGKPIAVGQSNLQPK